MQKTRSQRPRPIGRPSIAIAVAAAIVLLGIAGEPGQSQAQSGGALYLMRARWYQPATARFVSRDPIRGTDPLRINPYQAFFGDPIAFVDPMGTDPTPAEKLLRMLDASLEEARLMLARARLAEIEAAASGDEKTSRRYLENTIPHYERRVQSLEETTKRAAKAVESERAVREREEREAAQHRNEELARRIEMGAAGAGEYAPARDIDLFPQLSRWFGPNHWVPAPPADGHPAPAPADPQDLLDEFEKTLREVFATDDLSRMIGPSPLGMPQTAREAGASQPVPSEPTCPSEDLD